MSQKQSTIQPTARKQNKAFEQIIKVFLLAKNVLQIVQPIDLTVYRGCILLASASAFIADGCTVQRIIIDVHICRALLWNYLIETNNIQSNLLKHSNADTLEDRGTRTTQQMFIFIYVHIIYASA